MLKVTAGWVRISTKDAGRWPLGGGMALIYLACDVGDESCKLVFYLAVDAKKSSHTGGAASELLGGFNLFALTLCYNSTIIFIVGFLSKPGGTLASIGSIPRTDRKLTFAT